MEALWLTVLGVLTVGYFALAGFDYGSGLLLPFSRREAVLHRMTPFFLGNEVWLVAVVGVLFAAFPRLEGELLSGAHSTFTLLLAGLVLFMASVQLRLWWWLVFTGALMVSAGWGLFLVHLLDAPWPVAFVMPVLFALHGWAFQHRKALFPVTAALCGLPIPLAFSSIDVTGLMAHPDTLGLLAWVAIPVIPLVVVLQWSIVVLSSR
ncbi:cytochrome d ubiquinol oxidase subunit II [Lentzea sp. HUAS12]|uniref:cytochrome d ubiquinol oxidase subunit II n=1 Tax=Lentzea sp. HUAS12 TaxID=2951806 RepID=UPI00209CBF4E|nr:cytochrome d ubiquinol oxidase subunit II [Lentzea sp. HUAS12]USX49205.1 cytochrome d ubiquinol oxidase subunit II [Lentzea sp. HUAS12]